MCSISTFPGALDGSVDGTSSAAPLISGAAAQLEAHPPALTPAQVRRRTLAAAEPRPIPGDPDASPEGALNVSTV